MLLTEKAMLSHLVQLLASLSKEEMQHSSEIRMGRSFVPCRVIIQGFGKVRADQVKKGGNVKKLNRGGEGGK